MEDIHWAERRLNEMSDISLENGRIAGWVTSNYINLEKALYLIKHHSPAQRLLKFIRARQVGE